MSGSARRVVAALDIGTNSVLLSVASVDGGAQLQIIDQRATVTRLGQEVDRTGQLHPDAISRTLNCLKTYRELLDHHGVVQARAVGTSALRDAHGGPEFVTLAEEVLGFAPEVISGDREAELTFNGALSGLTHHGPAFVFDIGGGSTELIVGTRDEDGTTRFQHGTSLNIGSVRLTERVGVSNPPSTTQLVEIRRQVNAALQGSAITIPPGTRVIGVAGTVTTLAAIQEEMHAYDPSVIHGYELARSIVFDLTTRLGAMTVEERHTLPGLSPGRADVIVAGSILCDEIMSYANADSLLVSDRGVRFGLLAELATQPQ